MASRTYPGPSTMLASDPSSPQSLGHASSAIRSSRQNIRRWMPRSKATTLISQGTLLTRPSKALRDPESQVRQAIQMAVCFGPLNSVDALGSLLDDSDDQTALAAMTQMHCGHPQGVTPLRKWMESRQSSCPNGQRRASRLVLPAGQHEPKGKSASCCCFASIPRVPASEDPRSHGRCSVFCGGSTRG